MINYKGIEQKIPVKITNLLNREIKEYESIYSAARNIHVYMLNNLTVNAIIQAIYSRITGITKNNIYKKTIKIEKL